MSEDQKSPKKSPRTLAMYAVLALTGLILLSFIVEQCDSEKIRICDDATGDCSLESSCQPLAYSLF